MSEQGKGIFLFLAAWAVIPVMDACAKKLGQDGYSIIQIVWARFFFNAMIVLPMLYLRTPQAFRRPYRPAVQVVRVICLLLPTYFFFYAIRTLPLAEALSIYFVYPFFMTALAPWVLGEKVGLRRWSAVAVGFAGSLIIIRPDTAEVSLPVVFLLLGALTFAIYNLLTRKLVEAVGPGPLMGFQSLSGALIMSALVPFFWKTPDLAGLVLFVTIGLISASGHFLLIKAYRHAPASLLAPYCYFEIVSATVLGLVFFGNFPGAVTWLGVAVIVSSGVYISVRERRVSEAA